MSHGPSHAGTASSPSLRRFGGASLLVVLLALTIATVSAANAEARVPKRFFGIAQEGGLDETDYKQMRKTRVRNFRLSVFWRATEPHKGTFNWSRIDAQVKALAWNGISPAFLIWGAPK